MGRNYVILKDIAWLYYHAIFILYLKEVNSAMPTIYNISGKDTDNSNNMIPSKQYVDRLAIIIVDSILEYINNSTPMDNSVVDISYDSENINISNQDKEVSTVPVDMIDTDSNHQFISSALMNIFKDKPSKLDLENSINELRSELLMKIDQYFTNILNTTNALQKIKEVFNLINSEDKFNDFMSELANKVSVDDLDDHIKSSLHLNNNDRKALNLLLSFIETGCADWDAKPEDPNYIRNKPESLPANGGNAETLDGHSFNDTVNKQSVDAIVGVDNQNYPSYSVDYFVSNDESSSESNFDDIMKKINDSHRGVYNFKTGIYRGESIELNSATDFYTEIVIAGNGKNTIFNTKDISVNGYVTLKDLAINNATIRIGSDCKFDNVTFRNCNIIVSGNNNIIKWCDILSSEFSYAGPCYNNMITYNRYNNKLNLIFAGGNNIASNNIEI